MAAVDLSGTWKLDRHANWVDLVTEHGAEASLCHLGKEDEILKIEHLPGKLRMVMEFGSKRRLHEIKVPGETLMPTGPDQQTKWTAEWQDNKLVVHVSKPDPTSHVDPDTTTREIVEGELVVTHQFSGITAQKFFKRV